MSQRPAAWCLPSLATYLWKGLISSQLDLDISSPISESSVPDIFYRRFDRALIRGGPAKYLITQFLVFFASAIAATFFSQLKYSGVA